MSTFIKSIFNFLSSPVKRRTLWVGILCLAALFEYFHLDLARRTFVFYTVSDGSIVVEDRMLKQAGANSRERNIIRYTEEALLGPVAPDLLPLFPRETRLKSLLFRDGTVYIDFTEDAALPPVEGGETLVNYKTLYAGILRNFSYVKNVRFFIEGRAVYADELLHEDT
ncbi:MAG: GerMN domain-containing protein [Treponema sp.]|nr:GerMN domain-containing protein [Treponema sp.]